MVVCLFRVGSRFVLVLFRFGFRVCLRVSIKICVGADQNLFRVDSGGIWDWFVVGLVTYFWLVQGWCRIYVGLVCGLFGFA